jgi:3-deoxy-D-manno-octulosonic-acid transferase
MPTEAAAPRTVNGAPRPRSRLRGLLTMGIYQPLFLLAFLLYSPVLGWRLLFDRRYRAGLCQRMGFVPAMSGDRPVVWIHGVSVGEIKAATNIIARLRELRPDLQLVLSATTPNGHHVARQEHGELPVVFYPLDFGGFPRRALARLRPRCVLLMELEIWPNFLQAAARRGIPVAVINGRISERTFRGYRLARGLLPQLDLIAIYCVQDRAYRQRLLDLGVDPTRVHVTGNMKYDSVVMESDGRGARALRKWLAAAGQLVVVAGSTHGEEEGWVTAAVRGAAQTLGAAVRLVLVPRHPERAPAVCETLNAHGCQPIRWSHVAALAAPLPADAVVVVDVIGQLQRFYGACDVAFVGGSLVPHGGQNMLEPAAQGRATVFGPHTFNFRTDVELLLREGAAVQVADLSGLEPCFVELLGSSERRRQLGARAIGVIAANQGATLRTLELVGPLLGSPRAASAVHR